MLSKTVLSSVHVLVVGDVMLDRYWLGAVHRISPEAPVPIVGVDKVELRVGGAGNVAMNVKALGANCHLVSVIGDDEAGKSLDQILSSHDVNRHLHIDTESKTTEKLRIIARNQQLLRADFEKPPRSDVIDRCLTDYEQLLPEVDVVVISDYGKGSLKNLEWMIQSARDCSTPVVVDPKGRDFSGYRGATVVTPNEVELREVIGSWSTNAEMEEKATTLIQQVGLDALLVTQGERGMTFFRVGHKPLSEFVRSLEVYDVSGAGDTVVAMAAVCLAAGCTWEEILRNANIAAGVVVSKLGTAVATLSEIQSVLSEGKPK